MTDKNTGPEQRTELIKLFNNRIKNPSSYIYLDSCLPVLMTTEDKYDLTITDRRVGHGALVLANIQNDEEAIPFALDPAMHQRISVDDLAFGLHQYVANEALDNLIGITTGLEGTLTLFREDSGKIIALGRGRMREVMQNEAETIRRLTLQTPHVMFGFNRFEDERPIKIEEGVIYERSRGSDGTWEKQHAPNSS